MFKSLLCLFKKHDLEHVANFGNKKEDRRGLWQCKRCKLVHMDAPSEFYDKRECKQPAI